MTTATDTQIDVAVIDGLRPQARRYDVAVSDELVLAVLPNGAKTWTWVYDGPGQPHRQTLGVYPEMSLEQARQAQTSAARTRQEREAPAEYVIRDGRIQPSVRAVNWKWPLAGAVAILGAGILIGWLLLGDGRPDSAPPGETMTMDTRLEATREQVTTAAPATQTTPPAAQATAEPELTPPPTAQATAEPEPTPTPTAQATPEPELTPPPTAQATAEPELTPPPTAQATAEPEPTPPSTAQATAEPEPTPTPTAQATAEPELTPTPTAQATAEPEPTPPSTAQATAEPEPTPTPTAQATPEPELTPALAEQTPPAPAEAVDPEPAGIGARLSPGTDYEPGITDARVARAQVTTAVVQREPVDALGPVLVGTGEDIQTYYFFTELRSLAGQRVRHRWIAGDRIQADIPFNVGEAWRWRVFSNKRLLASLAGPWRVQVVTDDDVVIYDFAFEFQP